MTFCQSHGNKYHDQNSAVVRNNDVYLHGSDKLCVILSYDTCIEGPPISPEFIFIQGQTHNVGSLGIKSYNQAIYESIYGKGGGLLLFFFFLFRKWLILLSF